MHFLHHNHHINYYTSSQSNNHPDINHSMLKNTTPYATTNLNPRATVLQTSHSIYTSATKHSCAPPTQTPFTHHNTNVQCTHTYPTSIPRTLPISPTTPHLKNALPCTLHFHTQTCPHPPSPPPQKKATETSYRKSTLPKSAKTIYVGMHSHKKCLPQKPMEQ